MKVYRSGEADILSSERGTVNFTSVEKLRTLRIAWLHRKVMVEDFRTQYAFFNGSEIYCTASQCVFSQFFCTDILSCKLCVLAYMYVN